MCLSVSGCTMVPLLSFRACVCGSKWTESRSMLCLQEKTLNALTLHAACFVYSRISNFTFRSTL